MIIKEYSGARDSLIHEKKLKSKISCQTPFKEGFSTSRTFVERLLSLSLLQNLNPLIGLHAFRMVSDIVGDPEPDPQDPHVQRFGSG
jgi:hypothetical protein